VLTIAFAVISAVSITMAGPVLASAYPGHVAPARPGEGMGLIHLDYPRGTVLLAPGETSSWDVAVAFVPNVVEALVLELDTPPGGSAATEGLTVSASACSSPFTVEGCPETRFEMLTPGPASSMPASTLVLSPPTSGLRDVLHIRIDVSAAPTALAGTDSESLQIQIVATASGSASDGTSPSQGAEDSQLPHTGALIGGYLLLAATAIVVGTLVARFGRATDTGNVAA
jgi:hypothetical protein